jgi:hypothetical protein
MQQTLDSFRRQLNIHSQPAPAASPSSSRIPGGAFSPAPASSAASTPTRSRQAPAFPRQQGSASQLTPPPAFGSPASARGTPQQQARQQAQQQAQQHAGYLSPGVPPSPGDLLSDPANQRSSMTLLVSKLQSAPSVEVLRSLRDATTKVPPSLWANYMATVRGRPVRDALCRLCSARPEIRSADVAAC